MPPWNDSMEAILMILPPLCCAINCRAAAWQKKNTVFQIDIDDVVPVLFTEIDSVLAADDPRVIDQYIEMPVRIHGPRR